MWIAIVRFSITYHSSMLMIKRYYTYYYMQTGKQTMNDPISMCMYPETKVPRRRPRRSGHMGGGGARLSIDQGFLSHCG